MTVLHDIGFFWFPKGYVWKLIHSELSSLKIGTEFNKFSFLSMLWFIANWSLRIFILQCHWRRAGFFNQLLEQKFYGFKSILEMSNMNLMTFWLYLTCNLQVLSVLVQNAKKFLNRFNIFSLFYFILKHEIFSFQEPT